MWQGIGAFPNKLAFGVPNAVLARTIPRKVGERYVSKKSWCGRIDDSQNYKKIKELQYPVFIKPNKGGSSVATFFIRNENEVEDRLYEIQYKKYTPVIAHVERYFKDSLDIERIQDFIDNGYLIQVNATSFLGYHGKHAQKFAYQLLNQGLLHVIATDTHRCDGHRSPCLQEVFDLLVKKYSYEDIHTLMYENPLHIINNEEVDPIEGKTSFFKKIFKRR